MPDRRRNRTAGTAAIIGGVMGVVLGPMMVVVKYMTGWAIIPEPSWIAVVRPALGALLTFSTPVDMWIVYGTLYTVALSLMFGGLVALVLELKERTGRVQPAGVWVLMLGLVMVIGGDAVHTATWHQNGLTMPTPGTNPVANTGYAVHMMGMNLVLAGSLMTGISALRRRLLAPWLARFFVLLPASIVVLSLTLLPTTPSGGLWMFSVMMILVGHSLRSGHPIRS